MKAHKSQEAKEIPFRKLMKSEAMELYESIRIHKGLPPGL